jgi:hypothetical protein
MPCEGICFITVLDAAGSADRETVVSNNSKVINE